MQNLSEWIDNQKQSSSNVRNLLQERVEKANPYHSLTFEGNYTNLDLCGTQITLKKNSKINVDLPDFHFGINRVVYDITSKPPGSIEWE